MSNRSHSAQDNRLLPECGCRNVPTLKRLDSIHRAWSRALVSIHRTKARRRNRSRARDVFFPRPARLAIYNATRYDAPVLRCTSRVGVCKQRVNRDVRSDWPALGCSRSFVGGDSRRYQKHENPASRTVVRMDERRPSRRSRGEHRR